MKTRTYKGIEYSVKTITKEERDKGVCKYCRLQKTCNKLRVRSICEINKLGEFEMPDRILKKISV